jgi:inner membrane protein
MSLLSTDRSPGTKLALAIFIGFLLSFPLFTVWLLVYDRQQQSEFARSSIAEGWGGPQVIAGPTLVIPYRATTSETVTENGQQVTRSRQTWQELTLAPEVADLATEVRPERRSRSIYEVVVYDSRVSGQARFAMPADLSQLGIAATDMDLTRAELRFGLTDPRGLGANPRVRVGGQTLRLQPGGGSASTGGRGFFARVDAAGLAGQPIQVEFAYEFRGNGALSLAPQAGDTRWRVHSAWPHPSFQGSFLPNDRAVAADGFTAVYRVGNLALGQPLVWTGAPNAASAPPTPSVVTDDYSGRQMAAAPNGAQIAQISLVQPVDLYSQVNRATKYGFLFIGFTFLAFLMFDVIGGVRVSGVEYLLVGAGLVLFFVLLLAFAEVIGFAPAYLVAAGAIAGLNTAYSAAVLKSWRRAAFIGALLAGLYAVLYVLLSLEAYSLLIGSLMLFVALAAVMYVTRNLNWGGRTDEPETVETPVTTA